MKTKATIVSAIVAVLGLIGYAIYELKETNRLLSQITRTEFNNYVNLIEIRNASAQAANHAKIQTRLLCDIQFALMDARERLATIKDGNRCQ